MGTAPQLQMLQLHARVCTSLGIPASTLAHKKLKGTVSAVNPQGNRVYTPAGPIADFADQYESTFQIWWVSQPYIRGEQRYTDFEVGIMAMQSVQGQCPVLDVDGAPIAIEEDDFVIDARGTLWQVQNPVVDAANSFFTMLGQRQR